MTEEQKNELLGKVSNEVKAEFQRLWENAKEGYITSEKFKEDMNAFAETHKLSEMSGNIEKIATDLKKAMIEKSEKSMSIRDVIAAKADDLKKLQGKGIKTLTLDFKTDTLRSSITSDTMAMRLPDIGQAATRRVTIPSLLRRVNVSPNNHGVIRYFDQTTTTRNAAPKAEASAAPESALAWIEYSLALEKLLDSIPVSHEAITDVDFIEGEVRRFLDVNMMLKEEQQLYAGTGVAPEWEGLYSVYATDYTQALGAAFKAATGGIADASVADLAMVIATHIGNGYNGKYSANFVLLNPVDFLGLRTKKDSNNNYIIPPFMAMDGSRVGAMQVVESSLVTAGTMLVGDSNWATYYQQEGFTIELGWTDTQFAEDLMTLKARKRGNLLVRTVDLGAFYKVTNITQRITDISA